MADAVGQPGVDSTVLAPEDPAVAPRSSHRTA
jgi:hypothetical protein